MFMPEKVRLSIDLICYLKKLPDGKPQRVEDLAVLMGTTKNFLHQVVSQLNKAGMLSVIKGPKGGVLSNLKEVTLLDVYNLFGYLKEPVDTKFADSSSVEVLIRKFFKDTHI
jgi:DNA-binding IscR family transcriptional regulator